jgi:signal transduction histidine kinase
MANILTSLDEMTLRLSVLTAMVILGMALLALWAVRTTADQRRADEALETEKANTKMHLQFTEAQRLQEMGALSAVIAHEVNNLMTPIMANSLMLLEGTPPDDTDNYDSLLEIYNASEHAKELIGKISTVNRRDRHKAFGPVKVDDVLRQAYKVLDIMPKVDIAVTLHTGCGDATVNGSEMHLLQVIMNLSTNAYHAMEETGGVLTISSRRSADGRHAEILVADTGGGIPVGDADRIFEPFYTTKPAGKGTGLGLAIVKEIVRELGGTVSVANVGGGAEFTVSLPILGK